MKRRLLQVIVFLLLGAIVNVAVAWGLARTYSFSHSQIRWEDIQFSQADSAWWTFRYYEQPGTSYLVWGGSRPENLDNIAPLKQPLEPRLPPWTIASGLDQSRFSDRARVQCHERAHGLPFRAIYWAMELAGSPQQVTGLINWHELKQGELVRLPFVLRPIWPGFAINTMFYAAVLWVMFVLPFALRRRLRIRRGLCPACAYPIGSSPVCTECGASLPLPLGEGRGEGA